MKGIGKGLINLNLVPVINEYANYNLRIFGVISDNREEYFLMT